MASATPGSLQSYRTAFHFQPPSNWMNDPNAPMYHNGLYHLFYQHNPEAPEWSPAIIWGHAVSRDLINWSHLPPALLRDKSFDVGGCWSGSATLLPGNIPAILYTGHDENKRETQSVAFPSDLSDPFLRNWSKPDFNPVIPVPPGTDPFNFRDPSTAWRGSNGQWRVIVGGIEGRKGKVLLFKSKDFENWVPAVRPLYSIEESGMLECPDFFPVHEQGEEEKYLLKVGLFDRFTDHYLIGRYEEGKEEEGDVFVADGDEEPAEGGVGIRYDYGLFYASKAFYDEGRRRRVLWGWVKEMDTKEDSAAKGWAGIQTIPRVLQLDKNGKQLIQWPVEELKSLRRQEIQMSGLEITRGSPIEIKGLNAAQIDVEVDFDLQSLDNVETLDPEWLKDPQKLCCQKGPFVSGGIGPFGLLVLASGDLEEHTAVFFRIFKLGDAYVTLMCSDQTRSSLREETSKPAYGAFVDVDIQKTKQISLRTLVDHSVVESFGANGRTCITARIYPVALKLEDVHLFIFNNGVEPVKANLKAWEMANAEIK